jgi:hypothetical protein
MVHNLQLIHWTRLRTYSEHDQAISHMFSEHAWKWELILLFSSVFKEHAESTPACSEITFAMFKRVQ